MGNEQLVKRGGVRDGQPTASQPHPSSVNTFSSFRPGNDAAVRPPNMELSDRLVVMGDGRKIADGLPT